MRIGLDFDNTIACYDQSFLLAATQAGLVKAGFVGGKQEIRDAIRQRADGETEWMRLQGRVYGALMERAAVMPGLYDFLSAAHRMGHDLFVVSHKTRYGHFDPERIDLRLSALEWMKKQRLLETSETGLSKESVFFESTRSEKICRISMLELDVFVDDLPEVLNDSEFPKDTKKILIGGDEIVGLNCCQNFFDVSVNVL